MPSRNDPSDVFAREADKMAEDAGEELKNTARRLWAGIYTKLCAVDAVSVGNLAAVRERLQRILDYLLELHPPETEGKDASGKRKPRKKQEPVSTPKVGTVLAEIRGTLDQIENVIARALPHRSSGTGSYKFRGRQRMTTVDGAAIRAEVKVKPHEEVMRRWCLSKEQFGKGGFPGGQGQYTTWQVGSALAQDSGGHRRRRGIA